MIKILAKVLVLPFKLCESYYEILSKLSDELECEGFSESNAILLSSIFGILIVMLPFLLTTLLK